MKKKFIGVAVAIAPTSFYWLAGNELVRGSTLASLVAIGMFLGVVVWLMLELG